MNHTPDQRFIALKSWLDVVLPKQKWTLTKLAGDASFRRYFRVFSSDHTWVVMDAPPDKENIRPFIAIANAFAKLGVGVPKILAASLDQGFLLLSDLGDRLYLGELSLENVGVLYLKAFMVMQRIQACKMIPGWPLVHFSDGIIIKELQLFPRWFLQQHLEINITASIQHVLERTFDLLIHSAHTQPQTCVHRDYHSRNLLLLDNSEIGVLDFQDAVWGPITYDAVSLLRDCYIAWPKTHVENWILQFYDQIYDDSSLKGASKEEFLYWFDLIGLQRHLKVLGIFARLYHRDGKKNYLGDMPRILNYVLEVCGKYTELKKLQNFLQTLVAPKFDTGIHNTSNSGKYL